MPIAGRKPRSGVRNLGSAKCLRGGTPPQSQPSPLKGEGVHVVPSGLEILLLLPCQCSILSFLPRRLPIAFSCYLGRRTTCSLPLEGGGKGGGVTWTLDIEHSILDIPFGPSWRSGTPPLAVGTDQLTDPIPPQGVGHPGAFSSVFLERSARFSATSRTGFTRLTIQSHPEGRLPVENSPRHPFHPG